MKFKIKIAFSYLFFFLFVFVSLSLLVSTFWDSFSQLYALLTQSGRIFDFFLYGFIFVGFIFCIIALREKHKIKAKDRAKLIIVLL